VNEDQMEEADKWMLHLMGLDHSISLKFSESTLSWFTDSSIMIKNGSFLRSAASHGDTPYEAVNIMFSILTTLILGRISSVALSRARPR